MWGKSIKYQIHIFYQIAWCCYVCCWNFYVALTQRVLLWHHQQNPKRKRKNTEPTKQKTVSALKQEKWRDKEREKLFYSDSMETINYKWYTLNIPRVRDCYAKARSAIVDINLSYEIRLFSFFCPWPWPRKPEVEDCQNILCPSL